MPIDYLEKGYQPMQIQMIQETKNEIIKELSTDLTHLILNLRKFKPENRGDLDRRFAIAITDAEKLDAYITQYILGPISNNE